MRSKGQRSRRKEVSRQIEMVPPVERTASQNDEVVRLLPGWSWFRRCIRMRRICPLYPSRDWSPFQFAGYAANPRVKALSMLITECRMSFRVSGSFRRIPVGNLAVCCRLLAWRTAVFSIFMTVLQFNNIGNRGRGRTSKRMDASYNLFCCGESAAV